MPEPGIFVLHISTFLGFEIGEQILTISKTS
jgi:hypothetical protein